MLQRKYTWLLALIVSLAIVLAACGETASITEPPPAEQPGSIQLIVEGVEEANIMVALGGETLFDELVVGSKTLENLKPGQYAVDGMPADHCTDPTARMVTVKANETTRVDMIYIQHETNEAQQPVAKLELKTVTDDAGKPLPGQKEKNDVKDVMLYAAQTEEPICVALAATDAEGRPVSGAQVAINIADGSGLDDRIAILRGCADDALDISTQSFRDGIFTDADGTAKFTLYAAFGTPETARTLYTQEPAKIVVAAENQDGSLAITEFKTFFFNLAHLYFNDAYTAKRIGAQFEEFNIFDPEGLNQFGINVDLFTKQPQNPLALKAVGYMKFEVVEELNKLGKAADVVHFEDCTKVTKAGLNDVCTDQDGAVKLVPNDNIKLEDLPIQATVRASLIVQVRFGNTTYNFALKDFLVTKHWHGSFLTIDKQVDHHVLTWAGPEHHLFQAPKPNNLMDKTLAAKDDPAVTPASVFTATYSITVTNSGPEALYDITVADALPAEIGVITSTLDPAGATYDAINHVVTWNWLAAADARFDKLESGESITTTIEVYVRQKPGFCMDPDDFAATRDFEVKPIGKDIQRVPCYEDPYAVIDGKDPNDVTATFYTGAPLGKGGHQVKVDFAGQVNKDAVIIHAVRPLFDIDKTLLDPDQPMQVGEVAYFDIDITNLERPRYDALEARYPKEFTGARYNPYGRNVQVKDVFDTGLDFVSSSDLSVAGATYASSFVADKAVLWQTVPVMNYRGTGTARLALRANLPSHVDMKIEPTGAAEGGVKCVSEDDLWFNCAFLDADNLNQPEVEPWNGDYPWKQTELRPWYAAPLHHGMHENLRYGIRDCEPVKVVPPPGNPWVELDSESEYNIGDPNKATELPGVSDGDVYYYYFTVTNTGMKTATDVSLEAKLDCSGDPALITPSKDAHTLWYSNTSGASWSKVSDASFAGPEGGLCTVRFAGEDLAYGDPDPVFLYSVEVTATDSGGVQATAEATYSNATLQAGLLPLKVTEDTSVSPAP